MNKYFSPIVTISLVAAILAGVLLYVSWRRTLSEIERLTPAPVLSGDTPEVALKRMRLRPPIKTVKGVYLTAYSAGNPKKLDEIISLIDRTELNAVVIDIKDYTGRILYESQVPLAREIRSAQNLLGDVPAIIQKLHAHGIYVIARQTVFQDPFLSRAKPEWSMKERGGGLWRDFKGLSWVDPREKRVWEYNLAIAKEAEHLGFDEINFDYIRFPSDGDLTRVAGLREIKKHDVMRSFYDDVRESLLSGRSRVSFDLFGFVMEQVNGYDLGIGQRLADALDDADYISPMMYPSHYPRGHLGLANPAAYPSLVIEHGMKSSASLFTDHRAKLRPWIQAFNLGAVYDGKKIREEINAVEQHTHYGWLLWNAANRYTDAGLKKK